MDPGRPTLRDVVTLVLHGSTSSRAALGRELALAGDDRVWEVLASGVLRDEGISSATRCLEVLAAAAAADEVVAGRILSLLRGTGPAALQ